MMLFSEMSLFEVAIQVRVTRRPILVSLVEFFGLLTYKCLVCNDRLTATKLLYGITIVDDAI